MQRRVVENLVRKLYQARLANDRAATLAFFTDDAELKLPGTALGTGLDAKDQVPGTDVSALIDLLIDTWTWHRMDINTFVIEGDHAALRYTLEVTHNPTGERFDTEISDHLVFRQDKVCSFVEFVDTDTVRQLTAKADNT